MTYNVFSGTLNPTHFHFHWNLYNVYTKKSLVAGVPPRTLLGELTTPQDPMLDLWWLVNVALAVYNLHLQRSSWIAVPNYGHLSLVAFGIGRTYPPIHLQTDSFCINWDSKPCLLRHSMISCSSGWHEPLSPYLCTGAHGNISELDDVIVCLDDYRPS